MSHNARHGKSVAIVQARLGSSRLPLKSLLCLRDLPVIDWVTRRLAQSRRLDRIMVAVPDTELDRVLLEHLQRRGVPCLAGSENDVLARFCLAAREAEADLVGLGAEVLSRELLDDLDARAKQPSQREHCLNYIWDNAAQFRISTFDPEEGWLRRPDLKLDMDRPEDFRRLALLPLSPDMDARAIVNVFSN